MFTARTSLALCALVWLGCGDADPPGIVPLGSNMNNAVPMTPVADASISKVPVGVSAGGNRLDGGPLEVDGGEQEPAQDAALVESDAGSRYACNTDLDCVIRDIGSCCGYYPRCANVNAVFPPVSCPPGQAGICGFPAIDHCECRSNRCASLQDREGSLSPSP